MESQKPECAYGPFNSGRVVVRLYQGANTFVFEYLSFFTLKLMYLCLDNNKNLDVPWGREDRLEKTVAFHL